MNQSFQNLRNFRLNLFQSIPFRKSAVINLLDALCVKGNHSKSIVELSKSKFFERNYCSITKAITQGASATQINQIMNQWSSQSKGKLHRFVLDCTSASKNYSEKLSDRSCVYSPNPTPGNKPITLGHQYSVVAQLSEGRSQERKQWVFPVSCKRVKTSEKSILKGIQQLQQVIEETKINKERILSIGDSSYGNKEGILFLSKNPHHVHLFRLRNSRCLWKKVDPSLQETRKRGGQVYYGHKMKLKDPLTYPDPDHQDSFSFLNKQGKRIYVQAKAWENMIFRGEGEFKGHKHPLRVMQYLLTNESGESIYCRPLWLSSVGSWRDEMDLSESFYHYQDRYDIEHFFRFGKNNLLMDKYQTPDVDHEESWWQLVQLAYGQLFFAREEANTCPNDWERYLPEWKNLDPGLLTPAQTQRNFDKVLEEVSTPALDCIQRGRAPGRQKGETQIKRLSRSIVWKTKKRSSPKDSLQLLRKALLDVDGQMNREELLDLMKKSIQRSGFSIKEISEALLTS